MAHAPVTVGAWPAWHARTDWLQRPAPAHDGEPGGSVSTGGGRGTPGDCGLCGRTSRFGVGETSPSAREGLLCAYCRCNGRQRAAAMVLLDALSRPDRARVYATEQASPFYLALRHRVGKLLGSEFKVAFEQRLQLSRWLWRHGARRWVRCEDVTALRMRGASLDAVVTLDVLEHVPDYQAALREFARVLKPGGVLVATVPFHADHDENVQIARLDAQGAVEHLGEPEFHGDPLGGGVVCFHHFGWGLLAAMRDAGFREAVACRVQDPRRGLPQGNWVLRALR